MSLSWRTLLFAAIIVALAIAGIWNGPPLAGVWRWPAVLLIITIAWERWKLNHHYQIKREINPIIHLGKPSSYRLTICNHHRFEKLVLETQPDYESNWTAERPLQRWVLAADTSLSRQLTITPVVLGIAQLGKLYVRKLGRFGLVWWSYGFDDQQPVKVEPLVLADDQQVLGKADSGARKSYFKPGSGFELLSLRAYRYGDSLRAIDWKATAKRGSSMVRIFNQEQQLEIAILLDCGRVSRIQCGVLDRLHHYINITARLSEFATGHHDKIACMAYAGQIINIAPMGSGPLAVKRIRELLSGLSSRREEANPLYAALELKRLLKHRGLVVFLTEIEQPEASSQLVKAVQLLAVKHHVLVATIEDPEITGQTEQAAKSWMDPYQIFAAKEYCRERELTRSKLLRLGVDVVQAAPILMDQRILQYYLKLRQRVQI